MFVVVVAMADVGFPTTILSFKVVAGVDVVLIDKVLDSMALDFLVSVVSWCMIIPSGSFSFSGCIIT